MRGVGLENFRLRVFRAVAEEMSFRKAAEVLHLSQPAVSQHMRALEVMQVALEIVTGRPVLGTPLSA